MLELRNCERAILLALVSNRKSEGYNLHELARITYIDETINSKKYSYPAVRKYIPSLAEKGLVKIVGEEPYRGHTMVRYDVTIMGMMISFLHHKILRRPMQNITMQSIISAFQDNLPLVFGKWNYFKEQGIEDIVKKHLVSVMKLCASEYQHILAETKQHSERKGRYFKIREENREEWKKEKTWVVRITDVFLYYGLETRHLLRFFRYEKAGEIGYKGLGFEEKSELKEVINKDKQLRLYRMMLSKHEMYSHRRELSSLRVTGELFRAPEIIESKIAEMLLWKIREEDGFQNPFHRVVNAVYREDYFTATLELYKLYENFTFEKDKEIALALPEFMLSLIRIRRPDIDNAFVLQETKGQKPPKWIIEYLEKASLDALSVSYFFTFERIQVWDRRFYRLTPNVELIKRLEENEDQVKIEALSFARMFKQHISILEKEKQTT